MSRWVVAVESNCAVPGKEDDFNEWYNHVHIPDVLETAGVISATRYEAVDPSSGAAKYFAVYVLEADDLGAVMKAVKENIDKKRAQGRMSELFQSISTRRYRQIFSLSK
jgi:hypothetical protein